MDLVEVRALLERAAERLSETPFCIVHTFSRDARSLQLVLSRDFLKRTRKAKIWGTNDLCAAVKNVSYGLDPATARSSGQRDGVFLLDRGFEPVNDMMRKVFDGFLDSPRPDASELARFMGTSVDRLQAVRVVSHRLRLVGVLHTGPTTDMLGLVDFDRRQ